MKVTKEYLKQLIRESIEEQINEDKELQRLNAKKNAAATDAEKAAVEKEIEAYLKSKEVEDMLPTKSMAQAEKQPETSKSAPSVKRIDPEKLIQQTTSIVRRIAGDMQQLSKDLQAQLAAGPSGRGVPLGQLPPNKIPAISGQLEEKKKKK